VSVFACFLETYFRRSTRAMSEDKPRTVLERFLGQVVVVDLSSPYVCLGVLAQIHDDFLEILDADFHDLRDSPATREVYVYDSIRLGIRRNRGRVLVRRDQIVAISPFDEILES
jgi:hypothetical protein